MRCWAVRCWATAIIALCMSAGAAAQSTSEGGRAVDGPTVSVIVENDFFTANGDRFYTSGLRGVYLGAARRPAGFSGLVTRKLLGANDVSAVRQGFALGHSIFTPSIIAVAAPRPDDRPYAGWLYGEYTVVSATARHVDQLTLQAGVVGSSALGEDIQNFWHDLFGGPRSLGWDNQIDDEAGVTLSYDRFFRRARLFGDGSGLSADLSPSLGATVGNVQINGRFGLSLRLGEGLGDDYGPPRVRPALGGPAYFAPRKRFAWQVFAGAQVRGVAHDIFLDGSLFRDGDPSVPSRAVVGDVQGGLAIQFRRTQIAYTYVYRTREFDGQVEPQRFGAIAISRRF